MKADLNSLLENLMGFVKTEIELLKLDLKEDVAGAITSIVVFLVVFILGAIAFLFASFALAAFLNQQLASTYQGYLLVAFLYLILVFLIWLLYKNDKVKGYIDNFVLRLFTIEEEK